MNIIYFSHYRLTVFIVGASLHVTIIPATPLPENFPKHDSELSRKLNQLFSSSFHDKLPQQIDTRDVKAMFDLTQTHFVSIIK